jgi:hypothetical protein
MPQSWEPHWPLPEGEPAEVAATRRQRLIHTIGNLTLLNDSLNPMVSNGPWIGKAGEDGKRKAIAEHSVLHLSHQVCEQAEWTEISIRERSEALFGLARAIWSHPTMAAVREAA